MLTSIEICAGGGGQALGLEQAGFEHLALVENDRAACLTLRTNRPTWRVDEADVRVFSAAEFVGVDLLAGGVPCPPFSAAGQQLGADDERDLFPEALRLVDECRPRAVMLENVRGLMSMRFAGYRARVLATLNDMRYDADWQLVYARDYGVPQLRPRSVLVATDRAAATRFLWPAPAREAPLSIGDALRELMGSGGWAGAEDWADSAVGVAPTLVGGSKKHGGPDLGPTRAKEAWAQLGVSAHGIADAPPPQDFQGLPRLTIEMAARVQGFPPDWRFLGGKTAAYRQIGNAFPPPVARALGCAIRSCLEESDLERVA